MTVSAQTPRNQYTGNGSQTAYAYTFELLAAGDLAVYVGSTRLTLTTDYTVSGAGVGTSGGTVTFVVAPVNGATITLRRSMSYLRAVDYQTNGTFYASDVNADIDQRVLAEQQLQEQIARTIRLAPGDAYQGESTEITQNGVARASKIIGFDGSGNTALYDTFLAVPALLAGNGLSMIRVNAGGTNYELRTPTQTRTDIAAQPVDATLTGLSGQTVVANQLIYSTGVNTFAMAAFPSYARTLVSQPDAGSARTALALGSISTHDTTEYVATTTLGANSGTATLDSSGKLTTAQIPTALVGALKYSGTWNASTNSPTLTSGAGTQGNLYRVTTAGSTTLDGVSVWTVGDHAVFNGTIWEKWEGALSSGEITGGLGYTPLAPANNLSDVITPATALTNIGGIGAATTNTLTNKTLDTAGTGNVLKINGTTISAVTGTGSVVLATSPTIASPTFSGTVTGPDAGTWGASGLTTTQNVQGTNVITNGGYFIANSNWRIGAFGASQMGLYDSGATIKAIIDFATTNTIKFRNTTNTADAAITAGATTLSGAITYGGVTLSNSVTGTGSMVLSASPTFSGTQVIRGAYNSTNLALRIESTDGNGYSGSIGFYMTPSGGGGPYCGGLIQTENTNNTGATDGGRLDFYTADQAGSHALNRRMTIGPDGRVGIGTGAPGYMLDVVGNGNFSSGLTAAGITSTGSFTAGSSSQYGFTSRSAIQSPADGNLALYNNAASGFGLLQFGGTSSSFPAIKRNSTGFDLRLADDSGYSGLATGYLTINSTGFFSLNAGQFLFRNSGQTAGATLDVNTDSNLKVFGRDGTTLATVIAKTQTAGDNTTNVATTAFVTAAISASGGGTVSSVAVSGGTTGLTTSGGPITSTGTITLAGTLAVANGGTGVTASTGTGSNVLSASPTFTGTISAAAATLTGTLSVVTVAETYTAPTISAGTLTIDLSLGSVFNVSNNANLSTFTISNAPASKASAFTLILTANGTGYTQAWGGSVKWAGGTAPTITTTNTKKDILTLVTNDGGTTWFGFVAGQNF